MWSRGRLHAGAGDGTRRDSSLGNGALHLFGLSGFAVAQPLFDVISRNPTYLVAHGMSGRTVIAFAIGLIVVPPLLILAVVASVGVVSRRAAEVVLAIAAGLLFALTLAPPLARRMGSREFLIDGLYVALAVAGTAAYARFVAVRRYASWLGPAPVLFAIGFLLFGPASSFFSSPVLPARTAASDDAPSVVHLVLDELSLGSLLTPKGRIDAKRFPNFARLAERSTWYRNATTNSNATRHAVPAALTGQFPKSGHRIPPTVDVYPQNLFTVLAPTHRLEAGETVTSLCPLERCRTRVLPASAVKHLFADTTIVYLHGAMPPVVRRRIPILPEAQWAGFFADPLSVEQRVAHFPSWARGVARRLLEPLADDNAKPYSPEVQRFNALLRTIRAGSPPTVWFHHALLPHQPWHLGENAIPYDDQLTHDFHKGYWFSQEAADEALQRYVVQLKGTDALLGRLIRRLESQRLWDDTMLIVHADHGVTFRNTLYYRTIAGSAGDVLRIPLFIKYPNQHRGLTDVGNAELVDILPTVADVLGVRLPEGVDGLSLLGKTRHATRHVWTGTKPAYALPPMRDVPAPYVTGQVRRLFGPARAHDDIYAWGPNASIVGLRERLREDREVKLDRPERYETFDADAGFEPIRVSGTIHERQPPWTWLAVTVNGFDAGLGRPYANGTRFSILASPRYFRRSGNRIVVYGVSDGTDSQVPP